MDEFNINTIKDYENKLKEFNDITEQLESIANSNNPNLAKTIELKKKAEYLGNYLVKFIKKIDN